MYVYESAEREGVRDAAIARTGVARAPVEDAAIGGANADPVDAVLSLWARYALSLRGAAELVVVPLDV